MIYLATAPKSNAAYVAYKAAVRVAKAAGSLMPPRTILNAPTQFMKAEGYGADYAYDHDAPDAFSGQDYWPETLGRQQFYDPPDRGFEREIRKRLDWWEKLRKERQGGEPGFFAISFKCNAFHERGFQMRRVVLNRIGAVRLVRAAPRTGSGADNDPHLHARPWSFPPRLRSAAQRTPRAMRRRPLAAMTS